MGAYRRAVLVTVPGVEAVCTTEVDDGLDLGQLNTCYGMVGIQVPLGQL